MAPYLIRVSSYKGGVGKTTIAVNLAASLHLMGYETLLVDADMTNPAVGFHLGLTGANLGLYDLMTKKSSLNQATMIHGSSGLHILPSAIDRLPYIAKSEWINTCYGALHGSKYQFVIIDSSPGFSPPEILRHIDEALIVTTPDMPSCTSAVKLSLFFDKGKTKHRLAINRVRNLRYELHTKEISDIYEGRISAILPEDEIIPKSIGAHIPAIMLSKRSRFSKAALLMAMEYAHSLQDDYLGVRERGHSRPGLLSRLRAGRKR
jgi:MinD-like ATPase involved in chromosome partitioning or flagellar assembly